MEEYSSKIRVPESIVHNAAFSNGLESWNLKGCRGFVCDCLENPKILPLEGKSFAVATQRTDTWSGIEQTITNRIELETLYDVVAAVRISGPCSKAVVRATLYIQEADSSERYVTMGRLVIQPIFVLFYRNVFSGGLYLPIGMCCFFVLVFLRLIQSAA